MRTLHRTLSTVALAALLAGCGGSAATAAPAASDAPAATVEAEATPAPDASEATEEAATAAPAGDLGTATVTVDGKATDMTIHECGAPSTGWLRVVAGDGDTFVKIVLKPDDGGMPEIEGEVAGVAFLTKDDVVAWDGGKSGTITSGDYNSSAKIEITFTCE